MNRKKILYTCDTMEGEIREIIKQENIIDVDIRVFQIQCSKSILKNREFEITENNEHVDVLVLGGSCLKSMALKQNSNNRIYQQVFDQCFELITSKGVIEYFNRKGAYLLTPGWLVNWRKHLKEWGFDQQTAGEFFRESCQYLMLLDTCIYPDSITELKAFADYIQLPNESIPIGLDMLKQRVHYILGQIDPEKQTAEVIKESNISKKKMTDYAMALDVVSKLSESRNEKAVIENILALFSMLFAPNVMHYLSYQDSIPFQLFDQSGHQINDSVVQSKLSNIPIKYLWQESGKGFMLKVHFRDTILGVIEVDDLAFPEHKVHYLNLALFLSDICGLAIIHARTYQIVLDQNEQLEHNLRQLETSDKMVRKNLQEKEVLLKEINHRVKNNMAIISSLLSLQSRKIKDKQALAALEESSNRVKSMALIHERLYRSESLANIGFETYIRELCEQLFKSYNISHGRVKLNVKIHDINLDVSKGIPCGLLVNELISNALEHAFPGDRTGEVGVEMSVVNDSCRLRVWDNGIGLPESITLENTDSLGLQLIEIFSIQLEGSLKIQRDHRTAFIIDFPLTFDKSQV